MSRISLDIPHRARHLPLHPNNMYFCIHQSVTVNEAGAPPQSICSLWGTPNLPHNLPMSRYAQEGLYTILRTVHDDSRPCHVRTQWLSTPSSLSPFLIGHPIPSDFLLITSTLTQLRGTVLLSFFLTTLSALCALYIGN